MSNSGNGRRRIGRREAERLLSGRSGDAERPDLGYLLRAAAAPAHPDEIADEPAAVALFARQYELGRTAGAGEGYRFLRPRLAPGRAFALRLAVVLAALLAGGLVTGAETGILPAALQRPAHRLFSSLGIPPPSTAATPGRSSRASPPAGGVQPSPTPAPTAAGPTGTGAPVSADLATACRTYLTQGKDGLAAKELAALRAAAGGTEKITAFCTAALTTGAPPPTSAPGQSGDHPSHPAKPTKTHGPPNPKPSHK